MIVVLDRGKIVEVGSHAELVKRAGVYSQLFNEQTRKLRLTPRAYGAHARLAEPRGGVGKARRNRLKRSKRRSACGLRFEHQVEGQREETRRDERGLDVLRRQG